MSDSEMPSYPTHTLHTLHGIRRTAWRPDHPTELAVVSVSEGAVGGSTIQNTNITGGAISDVDEESRLEIWDVRRGHVAKYLLASAARPGEVGVIQDISWADDGALQACYSNGCFVQHDLRRHWRPLDDIPRQPGSWNVDNEFSFGLDRFIKGEIPFDDL